MYKRLDLDAIKSKIIAYKEQHPDVINRDVIRALKLNSYSYNAAMKKGFLSGRAAASKARRINRMSGNYEKVVTAQPTQAAKSELTVFAFRGNPDQVAKAISLMELN